MDVAQIGIFIWQLVLALLPAGAWLLICDLMLPLRKRVALSYFVATVLVLMFCVSTRNGLTLPGVLAAALAGIILYVFWKKAVKNRSLEADTIIGYHHDDVY